MRMVRSNLTIGEVRRVTGATLRQLDYWDSIGFIKPSGTNPQRKGWRSYSFDDLVRITAVVQLRKEGVSLQMMQEVIEALKEHSSDPLRELKLMVYGGKVFVYKSQEEVFEAMSKQATFLFVDFERLTEEAERLVMAA
jgi:DNA-binding transcriptional MerR regulator